MFRILIVEDIPSALEQLRILFSAAFPGSKTDTAGTVEEGLQLIREAEEKGCPYHVAVLDFQLPRDKGEHAEVDESLCYAIRDRMPETFVAHITAYPNDPIVLKHLQDVHLDYRDPRGISISKLDEVTWPDQLVRKVKAYLYGTRIEKQIDELFGTDKQRAAAGRNRLSRSIGRPSSGRSVTHELAALFRDIAAHWNDLDERLQRKIQGMFHVNTETPPIRVSLIGRVGIPEEE